MTLKPDTRPHLLMTGAYPDRNLVELEKSYQLHKLWLAEDREGFIRDCSAQVRAIATRGDLGADAALINALPHLEIISCFGVGTDAIDLGTAKSNGVRVTNTPDVLTGDVADLALGLALATLRKIPAAETHLRSKAWSAGNFGLVTRFFGKKVGIVGLGRIGQAVAKRCAGFDCEIAYFGTRQRAESPYPFFASLPDLAVWADVLIVTLAGGPATKNLINADVLRALGPNGYLVNVSRGSTTDETALLAALENHQIAGAGLDVFWNEPNIDARFLALDNVVLQPHAASGTIETRKAMGQLVSDNLAAHFAGKPLLTPVN